MLIKRTARRQRSKPATIAAPIGGLNGRDALASMPPKDAFVLDNIVPRNSSCRTRKGCESFATGLGAGVESLEAFEGGTSSVLLGFAGGSVFNVTAGGAVGAALATGRTEPRVATAMFSNLGAQFLVGCNGVDPPFNFNGTAFATTPAITGVTAVGGANALRAVQPFKGRLLYAATGELGFYYLAVGAIGGAASYFDLSQVARNGGYVTAISTVSNDSGTGPDDFAVFMTSKGEYIVYAGTDPSTAANWALVGRFYAPPPIGLKGWFHFQADLFIITATGILPFSVIRQTGAINEQQSALSSKLGEHFTGLTEYKAIDGWQGVLYPRSNMLVVNAPANAGGTNYYQFVMNTDTNAWCRFTGWDGLCFTVFNDRLYFGKADGTVMLADEGYDDAGEEILVNCRQAYNYFDDGNEQGFADKQFHFAAFVVRTSVQPPIAAELNVNFEADEPDYVGTTISSSSALWDVATWDVDEWDGAAITQTVTVPFGKLGYAASTWLRLRMSVADLEWYATRIVFERATGIGLL